MALFNHFVHQLTSRSHTIGQGSFLLARSLSTVNVQKKFGVPSAKVQEQTTLKQRRVLTLPNVLTISRIAVTPAVGYFIYSGSYPVALYCFAFAATTDLLDGLIARAFKQQSDLGAILDPIADKMLLVTSSLAMAHAGLLPIWLVNGYVVRDLFILLFGAFARNFSFHGTPTWSMFFNFHKYPALGFEPTLTSKCNTAAQCCLIIGHLTCAHLINDPDFVYWTWYIHISATSLVTLSFAQYIRRFIERPYWTKMQKVKG